MNQRINLWNELQGVKKAVIAGHLHPDGDAVGSCLGLYHYLRDNRRDISVTVYLEEVPQRFQMLEGWEEICFEIPETETYDVFFALDSADESRLGKAQTLLQQAKKTICIDHHISNKGYADVNVIVPESSSTSEVLVSLFEEERISREAAAALYLGIIQDTGVFRHSCTSPETMEAAAVLMKKGIDTSRIINESYYEKTYRQQQILGRALLEGSLLMDGRVIFCVLRKKTMDFYEVTAADLDGIVQELMETKGVETAIFLYETALQTYKVSLRSKEKVDVSKIASYFGGGGHIRAAGCTMQGTFFDVVNNITAHIEEQLCC